MNRFFRSPVVPEDVSISTIFPMEEMLSELSSGSDINIPVILVIGRLDGPRVYIGAGSHVYMDNLTVIERKDNHTSEWTKEKLEKHFKSILLVC